MKFPAAALLLFVSACVQHGVLDPGAGGAGGAVGVAGAGGGGAGGARGDVDPADAAQLDAGADAIDVDVPPWCFTPYKNAGSGSIRWIACDPSGGPIQTVCGAFAQCRTDCTWNGAPHCAEVPVTSVDGGCLRLCGDASD